MMQGHKFGGSNLKAKGLHVRQDEEFVHVRHL
jgi:hypothetical protein